jgi:kumamolisin
MPRTKTASLASLAALSTLAVSAIAGVSVAHATAVHPAAAARPVVLSAYAGKAKPVGAATTRQLTVSLSLGVRNQAGLNHVMAGLYNPHSPRYHHWLSSAQFNRRFAPTAAQRAAVRAYLRGQGLAAAAHGPFLISATGPAARIGTAFQTTLRTYRSGTRTFVANATPASVPASLSGTVKALVGLRNIGPHQTSYQTMPRSAPGYGGGPYGQGLTPSQQVSLNGGNTVASKGARGQGAGQTIALFELSGWTTSDITKWWQQFYGSRKMPVIKEIAVDGGPENPSCPTGDQCGPFDFSGPQPVGLDGPDYSGDVEVEADIEEVLAMAPAAKQIDVYNAPNDFNGQTSLDEYTQIAQDNTASVVSSSWGICEYDSEGDSATAPDPSYMQAEEPNFEKMATQGQSMFTSSGDTGAFDCLRGSGSNTPSVGDPADDPFVTGVGGSSYESWDPGKAKKPTAPADQTGVWNVLGLCYPGQDTTGGCAAFGAGGGGDSNYFTAPAWAAALKGYRNKASSSTCGSTGKSLCNQVPAISADADEFTPDAEYCSGATEPTVGGVNNPPNYPGDSDCAAIVGSNPAWFGIGGTSLSSPLWAGVFALINGAHSGSRLGVASEALFKMAEKAKSTKASLFDVTGKNLSEKDNGLFPTTKGYDQATGLGTPIISGLVTALK